MDIGRGLTDLTILPISPCSDTMTHALSLFFGSKKQFPTASRFAFVVVGQRSLETRFGTKEQSPRTQKTMNFMGLLIPGYPVRTDFQAIDQGKCVLTLSCPGDLKAPLASVTEIGLFLMPNAPLPEGHGVLCYWQITAALAQPGQAPAATGYELLGPMTPGKPSVIFQTGWAEHEQVVEISSTGVPVQVTFAISVEPVGSIENITPKPETRLFVAQKVAMDLFKYLQSFDSGTGGPGNMVVPNNIFDRWLQRFESKFRRDPNFFLRSKDT